MAIFIEIIDGANLGQKYLLDEGLYLGRSRADIMIADSKVSSSHAYVTHDSIKDQYFLIDNESSNGILVNQQKVKKVALLNGVNFQLGKTKFKVHHVHDFKVQPEDITEHMRWTTILKFLLPTITPPAATWQDQDIKLFEKPIILEFTQGIQMGDSMVFAYGPRTIGSETMNHRISEKECPPEAFYLIPDEKNIYFKTSFPEKVLLNNSSIEESVLKTNDEIKIGHTIMKVSFK